MGVAEAMKEEFKERLDPTIHTNVSKDALV